MEDNDDYDDDHVDLMMLIVIMRSHFVKICGRVEYLPGYETTCFPQQSGEAGDVDVEDSDEVGDEDDDVFELAGVRYLLGV